MNDNDIFAPGCEPNPSGILLCLQMLAEEAETLNLRRTVVALHAAAMTIEAEALDIAPSRLAFGCGGALAESQAN